MKICITSSGANLDSPVDPRFGRCPYFIFLDTEKKDDFRAIPNAGIGAVRGAGVQASQTVSDRGAEAVITGNIGPNSFAALSSSGIKIFQARPGTTVKEAVEGMEKGSIQEVSRPMGRFGRGRGFGKGGR